MAIAFLTTRVNGPKESDWKKLRRILQYLNGTLEMKRIVSINSLLESQIFIDAAYATNPDMRGQTGGVLRTGIGVLHGRSGKQRINAKSLTEAELIGCCEYMPYALWILNFLHEQGYSMRTKVLKQDNQSTMKLLRNGIRSAGHQSKHINIRFFWVTDCLKQNGIDLEYCPTDQMLGDFFTKLLQGRLFSIMRSIVMGHETTDDILKLRLLQSGNKSQPQYRKERAEVLNEKVSERKKNRQEKKPKILQKIRNMSDDGDCDDQTVKAGNISHERNNSSRNSRIDSKL